MARPPGFANILGYFPPRRNRSGRDDALSQKYDSGVRVVENHRRTQIMRRPRMVRLIIALLIPWLTFFTIGKPIQGFICLILQLSLIGWIPAAIWAVYQLSQYNTDKKIAEAGLSKD
jgi:uncharacterized membrane protein YqaE (UPF0057 family)